MSVTSWSGFIIPEDCKENSLQSVLLVLHLFVRQLRYLESDDHALSKTFSWASQLQKSVCSFGPFSILSLSVSALCLGAL